MSVNYLLKELYWLVFMLIASYLVIALNSSFSIEEPMQVCQNSSVKISKIWIVLQLGILLALTRFLFNYIMQLENQKVRYFLIPIVLFALPVSILIVWLQWMGC